MKIYWLYAMKKQLLILPILLFTHLAYAQTVANINVPDSITLPGGAGIRTKFIFDIYIGALYLEQKQNSASTIYSLAGNKRVHMHFLYDEISKEKLTNSWSEGFKNNHSDDELTKLQARIDTFNDLFTAVKKDDVVNLDFQPGKGTAVTINDEIKGNVKGDDFFVALLKIWLGTNPADSELKDAMLGNAND